MIFEALDTETDNREEGGQAILITTHGEAGGRELLFPNDWPAVWEFLKGRTYVAWNADFDIRAILHDNYLPWKRLRDLGRFNVTAWKGWTFKYVPSKFAVVRKGRESFTVYDLRQFYGASLKKAAEKHLQDVRKDEIPRAWYNRLVPLLRGGDWRKEKILAYARRDAEACYLLGRRLVSSFEAVGVTPTKLISPASLTMEFFGPQLKKEPALTPAENSLWERGFFGGRVEVGTLGVVNDVRVYDIHSAYPAEIAKLVSLADCDLVEGISRPAPTDQVAYGLYKIRAFVPLGWHWGPLAVRDGQKVIYPVGEVSTWCGLAGRQALERLNVDHQILEFHEYRLKRQGRFIFHGIENLYHSRKNPVLSLAAKLMLNSLYGKLCEGRRQRIPVGRFGYRAFRVYGRFTNYVLASAITERVRLRVFGVLHQFGRNAHFAATDSVCLSGALPTAPDLGAWDLKGEYSQAAILGCGRYWMKNKNGETELYLRGFVPNEATVKKLQSARRPYVRLPMLEPLSMLQWANDGFTQDLNVLTHVKKDLRLDDDKRAWDFRFKRLGDVFKHQIPSKPWVVGTYAGLLKLNG